MHLLLIATLASAAPDTGDGYCGKAWWVAEGTWTGDGCLVDPDPAKVCELLWLSSTCETWDAMVAATLDPESTASSRWSLGTCPDGGHVATGLTQPESSTTLYFEPGGTIAGGVLRGDSLWTNGCCEGNLTKTLLYGVLFDCTSPEAYVPPEPVDSDAPPLLAEPVQPTGPGCGCDQAAVGSPWWLVPALVVAARRRRSCT